MAQSFYKRIAQKIVKDNTLLRHLVKRQQLSGHPFKAIALTLCAFPVRNLIRLDTPFNFYISENYYAELYNLLKIAKVDGFELTRIGAKHDGGYIMLDDFHEGGIAYSFGISSDVSWDEDISSRGYDVFMYDHTINGLPEENSRFHWSKLGIADGITQDERLKTLEELISQNHHENKHGMILKMDVEGAEWGFLSAVSSETLAKFDQMTFEFHKITNPENPDLLLKALRNINRTHQLIHIHPNNFGETITVGQKKFTRCIEASYVLRDKYKFSKDDNIILPLKLDSPCLHFMPEIELGRWNDSSGSFDRASINIMDL